MESTSKSSPVVVLPWKMIDLNSGGVTSSPTVTVAVYGMKFLFDTVRFMFIESEGRSIDALPVAFVVDFPQNVVPFIMQITAPWTGLLEVSLTVNW